MYDAIKALGGYTIYEALSLAGLTFDDGVLNKGETVSIDELNGGLIIDYKRTVPDGNNNAHLKQNMGRSFSSTRAPKKR